MDADGLPIVGDGIDFTKVGAIHQKRTLAFLNHFISHTVRFLNRFSGVCEEKLEDLSGRLQRIETTMNILEAKLASVPGLENVTAPTSASAVASTAQQSAAETSEQPASTPTAGPTDTTPEPTPADVEEHQPSATPISKDPRFKKYFTMLNVGVGILAIQQKMRAEGVDPELIHTPHAPAPPAEHEEEEEESEEDSDSDYN